MPKKPKPNLTDVNNFEWRDKTSYAQGERGKVPPTTWVMGLDLCMDVVVHRWIYDPEKWFLSCTALNIDKQPLDSLDVEYARMEALEILEHHVDRLHDALVAAIIKTS